MEGPKKHDARLYQALELLRSIIAGVDEEGGPDESPSYQSRWAVPALPSIDSGARLSATDLLSWWFRAPSLAPNPWDTYFGESLRLMTTPVAKSPVEKRASPSELIQGLPSTENRVPPIEKVAAPISLAGLVRLGDDQIEDHDAEGAVGCLFDFVHAIGRREIDVAMSLVAEDYHVFEDDREIDRLALRHHIENIVDSLRGWEMEASLAEAPEPIAHPNGVLIETTIQIDAFRPSDDRRRSIVERCIAVLCRQEDGAWAISALSKV